MPGINLTPRVFNSWPGGASVVAFLVLWILTETIRRDEVRQPRRDSLNFAANDLVKALLSMSIWFISRQFQGILSSSIPTVTYHSHLNVPDVIHEREQGFTINSGGNPDCQELYPREVTITLGRLRSTLPILVTGFVYTLRAYTGLRTRQFIDPFTLHLAFPVTVLGILTIVHVLSLRHFTSPFWHAAVLQFAGFFIARDALVGSVFPPYSLLFAFAVCDSIWISLVDVIYGLYRSTSVHFVSTLIFAQSSLIHSLLFLLYPSHDVSLSHRNRFTIALQVLPSFPLIEAAQSIAAMFIIHQYGAINQGILISLASTFLITVDTWKFTEAPYSGFLGCLIAVLGSGIFILCVQHTDDQRHGLSVSVRRYVAAAMISLVALGHIVVVTFKNSGATNSSDLSPTWRITSGPSKGRSDCRAPGSSALTHTQTINNYTHFSNVLLIVFFSHARYDANLDFHREVYGDYFPNIVYVGPATREDKGFAHSYDVLVDSFQSKEDLSDPLFYRMAGRMAHHMLYTALREYECYEGYLWVPFDTLLNVPRLQQFNQSLFWYHSPWGHPVPNSALGDLTESGLNTSIHAPPAMISPDPSINITETWRGWGPDWWWGDPHVGLSVCMNAFHKVPVEMRDHLARLNSGQTRLIGGSVDTLYIPGRHREAFKDILALFLETDCFLEIATPTTVHLVVPPGEPIQFVDHWWIYRPPFNASFVRQKWAEGYEVDTFHTFHWGERGEDGVWQGDHRHVTDVRRLLQESAHRQGFADVFPVNLGDDDGKSHA